MITIKCDKCARESNNPYVFGNCAFTFIDEGCRARQVHLCIKCQLDLEGLEDQVRVAFIKENVEVVAMGKWKRREGVV